MDWKPARHAELARRLEPPKGPVELILDTDTYNEVDDQFALSYALRSPERIRLRAVCAAPFLNENSESPADGMEKSYREIVRLMAAAGADSEGIAFRGSDRYLPAPDAPVRSAAAERIVELALAHAGEEPLYVAAIGAITNVASAILMEPKIIGKIAVVWLGGHHPDWPTAREFNLEQDVFAARVALDSGVPLILVPCHPVASHLTVSAYELKACIGGKNALCDALVALFCAHSDDHFGWAKELWDVSAIAYLVDPGYTRSQLLPSPLLSETCRWSRDASRHPVRVLYWLNRNAIFRDLYGKLAKG